MTTATTIPATVAAEVMRLALRPAEAALAIGIGESTLAGLDIPRVKLGRAVLYPVDDLRAWLSERAAGSGEGGNS